jgi:hypothetical protein
MLILMAQAVAYSGGRYNHFIGFARAWGWVIAGSFVMDYESAAIRLGGKSKLDADGEGAPGTERVAPTIAWQMRLVIAQHQMRSARSFGAGPQALISLTVSRSPR